MKTLFKFLTGFLFLFLLISRTDAETKSGFGIIPKPVLEKQGQGVFKIGPKTLIAFPSKDPEMECLANYFSDEINKTSGIKPTTGKLDWGKIPENSIAISLVKSGNTSDSEGYSLEIAKTTVKITASDYQGVFYGIQTFLQILRGNSIEIPCVYIEDSPHFKWRGMNLDCSRHFMTKAFIKRYIDFLAFYKMNVFHWHLTDDQGWRLEIKKYPLLTTVGAWRTLQDGTRYGGFYTQEDVAEIIEYAKNRYITVVPEIEMPGHASAALAAYPEFSCTGKQIQVENEWGIHSNLFCAGKESTFQFITDVLTEVSRLFPSDYIHIGGDEAKKDKWKVCPDCQARIKNEGLSDEEHLQGYFTKRVDKIVTNLGKKVIGWDEILERGVSQNAIVESWRGMKGAYEASKLGHPVISAPYDYTYFDAPMLNKHSKADWMSVIPLEKAYSFNPAPSDLSKNQAALVLGGECCLWAEHSLQNEIDQQMFPRFCAFSEILWTKQSLQNWTDFSSRVEKQVKVFDSLGIDYFKPDIRIAGWNSADIADSAKYFERDITKFIRNKGSYKVSFVYEQGADSLNIGWAALLENGKEVSRDFHKGTSGKENKDQYYRFSLPAFNPGATYTIRANFLDNSGTDSQGSLWLDYYKVIAQ